MSLVIGQEALSPISSVNLRQISCCVIAIAGLLSLNICHGSETIQFIVSIRNCATIWVNHLRDIAIGIILVLNQATISLTNTCDLAFFVGRVLTSSCQVTHRHPTTIRIIGIEDLTILLFRVLHLEQLIQLVVVIADGFPIGLDYFFELVIDIVGIGLLISKTGHALH